MPENVDAAVELIHRIVGYPLAFVVAPFAIATFAGAARHRWAGWAFLALMTYLYLTGTALTLTRHEWLSWGFGRNVVFNLLGFSMVLYGARAMWLLTRPAAPRPAPIDRALLALLVATVAVMTGLAIFRNTPLRAFSLIGIGLVALEVRDWRGGFTNQALWRRHVRYMLGSYFYVLTVVSLVHLRDYASANVRWLWPAALGLLVIFLATRPPTLAAVRRAPAARIAIALTLGVTLALGTFVARELVREVAGAAAVSATSPPPPPPP